MSRKLARPCALANWNAGCFGFRPNMVRLLVLVLLTQSGCHFGLIGLVEASRSRGPYVAETISRELGPASVRTIGCLDVGLVPFQRDGGELVDVHIGNRCPDPEPLDLRRMAIRGDADRDIALSDPRSEIDLVHIGGAERGHERIRLDGAALTQRLCFDLERVDPSAPNAHPPPLCFDRTGGRWSPS